MPWFKVDDSLAFNAKFIALPLDAAGLWLRCGAWSAQQLTDGYVPQAVVTSMGATKQQSDSLVTAGLWEQTRDGFLFHDWNDYQPTAESVKAERMAAADRMRAFRERRKGVKKDEPAGQEPEPPDGYDEHTEPVTPNERRTNGERTPAVRDVFAFPDPVPVPVPSQPSPTHLVGDTSRRAKAKPLPGDWTPTDEHRKIANDRRLDLDAEAFAFRAHAEANDRRQVRWNASFSQWLANAAKWAPRGGSTRGGTDERVAGHLALAHRLHDQQQQLTQRPNPFGEIA